jgi:PadR family transcriptional regulator PadR
MCVLALLAPEDGYAYDIASCLARVIGMGEGTIYPLMRRLQSEGWVESYLVESASGPPRKYYLLTAAGRTALLTQKREWLAFVSQVNTILGAAA